MSRTPGQDWTAGAQPRFAPMGEHAVLVGPLEPDAVLRFFSALDAAPLPGQIDLVPGAESLLVVFAPSAPANSAAVRDVDLRWRASAATGVAAQRPDGGNVNIAGRGTGDQREGSSDEPVNIDVVYDGPDLGDVAQLVGLSTEAVMAAHTAATWRVAFCGFAPGFAYLDGGDTGLAVPRRDEPRAEVASGAVGLAGSYSGVYPRPSPGGWRIIGRTDAELWDLAREPSALLRPGMTVQFRPVRPSMTVSARLAGAGHEESKDSLPHRVSGATRTDATPTGGRHTGEIDVAATDLVVVRPGMQCLVQDLGRGGRAALGVSPSGAADRGAAMRANRLVGNPDRAGVLEILFGGATIRAERDLTIAVTGADVPLSLGSPSPAEDVDTHEPAGDGATPGLDQPFLLRAGATLRLGRPRTGLRSYIAVRGGVDAPLVLGSRATDVLSGIGPEPLHAGARLRLATRADRAQPGQDVIPDITLMHPQAATADFADAPLAIIPGPQWDWFTDDAQRALCAEPWTVDPHSNRVGVRLVGPALERRTPGEVPTQGLVRGAIQVPPSGQPIAFLADHPVTGGYPVIAVLTETAADAAAQVRPGDVVRICMTMLYDERP